MVLSRKTPSRLLLFFILQVCTFFNNLLRRFLGANCRETLISRYLSSYFWELEHKQLLDFYSEERK